MWININSPKSYNVSHIHPDCDLCGNIYIKTSKNCGNIFFEDPRFQSMGGATGKTRKH
ncbi:MAG: hypothetical protein HOB38_20815 [Deltaproteobacteria bacterium]|nr:hypothetical protein [Deltaproteobacteria bacterium]